MRFKGKCPSCGEKVSPEDFLCPNCELILDPSKLPAKPPSSVTDVSVVRRMMEVPQRGLPSAQPSKAPEASSADATRIMALPPEVNGVPIVVASLTKKAMALSDMEAFIVSLIDGASEAPALAKRAGIGELELRVVLHSLHTKMVVDFADEPLADEPLPPASPEAPPPLTEDEPLVMAPPSRHDADVPSIIVEGTLLADATPPPRRAGRQAPPQPDATPPPPQVRGAPEPDATPPPRARARGAIPPPDATPPAPPTPPPASRQGRGAARPLPPPPAGNLTDTVEDAGPPSRAAGGARPGRATAPPAVAQTARATAPPQRRAPPEPPSRAGSAAPPPAPREDDARSGRADTTAPPPPPDDARLAPAGHSGPRPLPARDGARATPPRGRAAPPSPPHDASARLPRRRSAPPPPRDNDDGAPPPGARATPPPPPGAHRTSTAPLADLFADDAPARPAEDARPPPALGDDGEAMPPPLGEEPPPPPQQPAAEAPPPPPRVERTDPRIAYGSRVNRKVLDALKQVKRRHDATEAPPPPADPQAPPVNVADVHAEPSIQVALRMEQGGRFNEAIRFLENAIAKSPDAPSLYNRLAIILMRERADYRRAETLMRKAVELDPENRVYSMNLTQVLSRAAIKLQKR
ncbi:MAG: hypothetical protein AMXMBFR34_19930 [Myxococcaceae bacterium]